MKRTNIVEKDGKYLITGYKFYKGKEVIEFGLLYWDSNGKCFRTVTRAPDENDRVDRGLMDYELILNPECELPDYFRDLGPALRPRKELKKLFYRYVGA